MKKIISFILLIALVLCAFPSALPAVAAEVPNGEAINDEADFLAMSASGSYYLEEDITISASYAETFSGALDGNGKTIKIAENANVSPFNKIANATIKNIIIEGVINVTSKTSYGGVAVEGNGSFENVITRVGISAMVIDSFNSVGVSQGCFIAKATGSCTFKDCVNEASITVVTQGIGATSDRTAGFGGFIGSATNAGTISFNNCFNNISIHSIEPVVSVGGFVGLSVSTDLNFDSCDNTGVIVAGNTEISSGNYCHVGAGGITGLMIGGSLNVTNCRNIADVTAYGGCAHIGGCVGRVSNVANITIDGFRNMCAVYNTSDVWEGVGGLIGIMSDCAVGSGGTYSFKDCINSGWVKGSMAGGLVGIDASAHGKNIIFERCANLSNVVTLGIAYAGGIIGRTDGILTGLTFKQCLNTGEVTTDSGGYGVGGIVGNIGVESNKSSYSYTPVFENCVNTGTIACKSTLSVVYACGILSRNIYMPTIFKNCVNLGTLSNANFSSNIAPITYNETSAPHSAIGCSYLAGTSSSVFGESAKSISAIGADVASALTTGLLSESEYYNYRNSDDAVNSVGEGVDKIRSASSVDDVNVGAKQIFANRSSLIPMSDKKAELIASVGEPINNAGRYTSTSYAAYLNAFEQIKSDISSAESSEALDAIDIALLKLEAEAKLKVVSADSDKTNITDSDGSSSKDFIVSYDKGETLSEPVYSIDVVWTDISFSYSEGSARWDPEKHDFTSNVEDAGWGDATGEITVINHSNAAVDISITFAPSNNGTASIEVVNDSFLLDSAVGTTVDEAPAQTTVVTATGVPEYSGAFGVLTVKMSKVN